MDGIIIINKPKGCTSHDIVYKVKKIFNQKVGHTGTLDPLAEGVLPVLIGKGTQCSKYLINHDKTYIARIQLGKKTTTADEEGQIIDEKKVPDEALKNDNVEKVLNDFIGIQEQIPPIYSAIKVKGKKLYEYAREGKEIEISPRKIEIYSIKLLNINKEAQQIEFEASCSKGTYIRSLCEDIAKKLNTVGYMARLNRIKVGNFEIENSITLEELENNKDNIDFLKKYIITIEKLFIKNEKIVIDTKKKIDLFLNGVQLTYKLNDGIYRVYDCNNNFIGTATIKDMLLKRDIIVI